MPVVGISPARALTVKVRVKSNATKQSLKFFMVSPEVQLMKEGWNGDSLDSRPQNAGIITPKRIIPVN